MSKDYRPYLKDIQRFSQQLHQYAEGLTRETLEDDKKLLEAILYNIIILGEAARRIPEATQAKYPQIRWKGIIGTRNFILHDYDKTDLDVIWNILSVQIPLLSEQIEVVLKAEGGE